MNSDNNNDNKPPNNNDNKPPNNDTKTPNNNDTKTPNNNDTKTPKITIKKRNIKTPDLNNKKSKQLNITAYNDYDDFDLFFGNSSYNIPPVHEKHWPLYDEPVIKEEDKEYVHINKKINTLTELIELGNTYDSTKRYNIDLALLNKLTFALQQLNDMVGMKKVKYDIVNHILFYIQKLDDSNMDMLHTVIDGPAGIGKTELAKILGNIYLQMGILKNNVFKKVSRPDMVAKYLGQTAIKTEELIHSCKGGVMFIDEVYALGNKDQRDSFSKEAIDTLNLKLTELKNEFICIVAGYPKDIEECFFSYNIGLRSRFPIHFTIDPYTPKELMEIFKKIVKNNNWSVDESITIAFFKENYKEFKYYGRDMEQLFAKCKRTHSKRIFGLSDDVKKIINYDDIVNAFDEFLINRT
jgi:AAA+ superfamily predicted ATPase